MEPTEEMKRMARRIAEASRESGPLGLGHPNAYKAALAAIMETSEMAARAAESELVEVYGDSPEIDTECNYLVRRLSSAIRSGDHLKDSNHV